tara:strand:- start:624 stop:839 length:216 start_codon:yes stop_codon:yes gene_type:complete
LVVNDEIIAAFDGGDVPDKLKDIMQRLLRLEDGGSGSITNSDAMTKLIEDIIEKTGSINDGEFLEWCKNNG